MTNKQLDFFKVVNNLARVAHIPSENVIKNRAVVFPWVSIVIPTYKRASLLSSAIQSALYQKDCPSFEVVVVDNNPERNCDTETFMASIDDERISYYKNHQNLGQIGNWNRCFELARGKWVVMLHDDDLLLEFFLRDCFAVIKTRPDTALLKPQWHHWVDDGGQPPKFPNDNNAGELQRIYEIDQLIADRIGAPTGIIVNREKFLQVGGFNPDFFPTADKCFVTLCAYYFEVYKLNKIASVYRFFNNDSLQTEVLQGFLRNDFYLFKQLCRRFKVPALITNNFLGYKLRNITGYYKNINPEFSFDKNSIGLTEPGRIAGRLAYILTSNIVLTYHKFYELFGWLVFKKRQQSLRTKKQATGIPVVALTITQFLEEGLVFFEEFQTFFSI